MRGYTPQQPHGFAAYWGIALRGGVPLVPMQLFESGFNLLLLTMMLTLRPEHKQKGILMPLYLIAIRLVVLVACGANYIVTTDCSFEHR